jgi:U32 family peptidase
MSKIGEVKSFYKNLSVATINLEHPIQIGDKIKIKGNTTHFTQIVESLQTNNTPIIDAKQGDLIGIKVKDKVKRNDSIFKIE